DQKLFVIAYVEKGHTPGQPAVEKSLRGNVGGPQPAQHGCPEISGTDAIQKDANFDAPAFGFGKRRDESAADFIVAEDIGGQRDARFRTPYRGQHRGIGLVSIAQNANAIASDNGPPCDFASYLGEKADIRQLRLEAFDSGRTRMCRLGPFELDRTARNAIDAKNIIEQSTQDRRKPRNADPCQRGAYIALFEKGMDRDGDCDHQIGAEDHHPDPFGRPGDRQPHDHSANAFPTIAPIASYSLAEEAALRPSPRPL